ncbi:hypothetical protein PG984_004204 [Apiospora sp. TS-2023a]
MPKASKPKRTERLAANSGQAPNPSMQVPLGRAAMAASPAVSNQQTIMPRPLMQPHPSAAPPMGGRMQHPAPAPPESMPPPPGRSSTSGVRPQAPSRAKYNFWSFVSGMMTSDDRGNPRRTPDQVATTLRQYIYQPANKMPQADAERLIAQRANNVINCITVMSGTWPFQNAMQSDRLNRLVGLLLGYNCIKRDTLGRAISKAWRNPNTLPTWVDLVVPRDDYQPAQAELEARARAAGMGSFFARVPNNGSVRPSQNPTQNPSRNPSQKISQNCLQRPLQNPLNARCPPVLPIRPRCNVLCRRRHRSTFTRSNPTQALLRYHRRSRGQEDVDSSQPGIRT